MYHIPKYRSPEPPALKKPSSNFWPHETNVWQSFMDCVAVMLSAAIELFGNKYIKVKEIVRNKKLSFCFSISFLIFHFTCSNKSQEACNRLAKVCKDFIKCRIVICHGPGLPYNGSLNCLPLQLPRRSNRKQKTLHIIIIC